MVVHTVMRRQVARVPLPVQGVWYTFNTGVNSRMIINLLDFDIDPIYTAPNLSYALYSGACVGNGASVEVSCISSADGSTVTPVLNQFADYSLLVYNQGGIGLEGTFGLLIEKPLLNDVGITSVVEPSGLVCGTVVNPVVTLRNYGENTLTSVNIDIAIDGGAPIFTYAWTGSVAFGQSVQVTLPDVVIPSGQHIMNATTSLPNGVPDELASNDAGSGSYDQSGEAVTLAIQTDNWPQETTWEIYDAFFFPVANGGPYPGQNNSLILEQLCLSTDFGNCYSLYIYDSFGDGICCGFGIGYWELQNPSGEVLLRDIFHGSGTYPGSTDIGGAVTPTTTPLSVSYTGHDFCLPSGPANILSSECGITTNTLQSKVYCQPVAGATSYQFEFLNPDAGFRRRIVVTGRTWVKFSEMVTVPLVPGTTYFAHVRADRNTPGFDDDFFGAGCEMALDATQVPGCTQLLDDTALPTHSCGVSKLFGAGDKVYALPVVGATQYRFKFENAGEGFVRVISRPNYICLLNWTTLPLQVGVTYSVKVEVLVNGIWSGYCGNACSLTIAAPPAAGGSTNRDVAVTSDNADMLQIWPNPVRDGQVNLLLSNLVDAEQRISVDVIDLFGKRVHSQQFNNSGDVFNTVLELDGLASGVYVVNLTVNDRILTERITVQ